MFQRRFHIASCCKIFPSNFKARHLLSAAPRDMDATWNAVAAREHSGSDDNSRQAFEPCNDRGIETVETVPDSKAKGVWGKFIHWQFEERDRLNLGCRCNASKHRNKSGPVKTAA